MLHSIAPARHLRRRAVQHQTRPEWTLESDLQCDQRIQEISARIGRVTGGRHCCQPPQELSQASSLRRAVCGVGSQCLQSRSRYRRDGIGDAVSVAGGNAGLFIAIFGIGSLAAVLLVPYSTYAKYLKWLTISLFACRRSCRWT